MNQWVVLTPTVAAKLVLNWSRQLIATHFLIRLIMIMIGVSIATARAGNVIGGGDWSKYRLIPDILRAIENRHSVSIRNPNGIRPWQHVLDPLNGYLVLAEKLYAEGSIFAEAFNFGPSEEDSKSVQWIVEQLTERVG